MRRTTWIPAAGGAALLAFVGLAALAIACSAPPDQRLLRLFTRGSIAEAQLGRLAISRSADPTILDLGARLDREGSQGVASLRTLAAVLHVRLPAAPGAAQLRQIARLSRLRGAAFDERFERIAHADERRMVRRLRSAASTARSAAVRDTVRDMIPAIEIPLRLADGSPSRARKASPASLR
jgi:putative membrane protein